MECCICYENYNKTTRREIKCDACKASACYCCYKQYTKNSITEMKCMHCNELWLSYRTLYTKFPKSYVNKEYKAHLEKLCRDRTLKLVEEVQAEIEILHKMRQNRKENYLLSEEKFVWRYVYEGIAQSDQDAKYILKYRTILSEMRGSKCTAHTLDYFLSNKCFQKNHHTPNSKLDRARLHDLHEKFDQLRTEHMAYIEKYKKKKRKNVPVGKIVNQLDEKGRELWREYVQLRDHLNGRTVKEESVVKFFGKCPADQCNGLISNGWKCGICEVSVCKICMERLEKDHTCDDNVVKNVQELRRHTKPCPGCKAPIVKYVGCAQVWCTICHITFNWTTGKEEKTTFMHNPHYLDWIRANPDADPYEHGATARIHGEGCMSVYDQLLRLDLRQHVKGRNHKVQGLGRKEVETVLTDFLRVRNEYMDYFHRSMDEIEDMHHTNNKKLTEKYLTNKNGTFTYEKLCVQIQRNGKKKDKAIEKLQIFQLEEILFGDLYRRFLQPEKISAKNIGLFVKHFFKVVGETNRLFTEYGKVYNCVFPQYTFHPEKELKWTIVKVKYTEKESARNGAVLMTNGDDDTHPFTNMVKQMSEMGLN